MAGTGPYTLNATGPNVPADLQGALPATLASDVITELTAALLPQNPFFQNTVDLDLNADQVSGSYNASGVSIGNGYVLTAGHNFASLPGFNGSAYSPFTGITEANQTGGLTLGQSFFSAIIPLDFHSSGANSVTNFGQYGEDVALVRTVPQPQPLGEPTPVADLPQAGMIVFSDRNEAEGTVFAYGYPGNQAFIFDNDFSTETPFRFEGTLSTNSYSSDAIGGLTGAWNIPNLLGLPGASGSGVFLEYGGETFLSGIFSGVATPRDEGGNLVTSGGVPITSFNGTFLDSTGAAVIADAAVFEYSYVEPITDFYHRLASTLAAQGVDLTTFGTNRIIADKDGNVSTEVEGTGFNEDIYTSSVTTRVEGSGGTDTVYLSVDDYTAARSQIEQIEMNGTVTGTLNLDGGRTLEFEDVEGFKVAGFATPSNPLSAINDAIVFVFNNATTSIDATDGTVAPIGRDIGPIVLALLGLTEDDVTVGSPPFEFNLLTIALSQLGLSTVDRFVVDFGPDVEMASVSQEQDGNNLLLNYTEAGVAKTMTLTGVYADGNADEIVRLTFDGGTTSAVLADIPEPEPANIVDGTSGNDVLHGTPGVDIMSGFAGNDRIIGSDGADEIDGGAGIDTVDYRNSDSGVTVNFVSGTGTGGDAQGDTYTAVERAYGSQFADVITGDSGNNLFYTYGGNDIINAGAGNDYVRGGAGADQMDGGAGLDYLDYRDSTAGVTINLLTGAASGGYAQGDTFSNFERVLGSNSNDNITGDATNNLLYSYDGNDVINGGGGNDTIRGGAGADTLDGGSGSDWLVYRSSTSGVTVNLLTGTASGGYAQGDVFSNFERVQGSNHADNITGDNGNNLLYSYDGNDVINGGAGNDLLRGGTGADTLNGGSGLDIADYRSSSAGVTVNLASQTATGGEAQGDTLISIERAYGSNHADSLTGDSGANLLYGYSGNDVIHGGEGNDLIRGGNGNDTISLIGADTVFGDAGNDTFQLVFNAFDGSTIRDFTQGDVIDLSSVFVGGNGGLSGISNLSELLSYASQSGNNVILDFEGVSVTLTNTALSSLDSSDFIFGSDNPFPNDPDDPFPLNSSTSETFARYEDVIPLMEVPFVQDFADTLI